MDTCITAMDYEDISGEQLASGHLSQFANLNMAIEIIDPFKMVVILHRYSNFPEVMVYGRCGPVPYV